MNNIFVLDFPFTSTDLSVFTGINSHFLTHITFNPITKSSSPTVEIFLKLIIIAIKIFMLFFFYINALYFGLDENKTAMCHSFASNLNHQLL